MALLNICRTTTLTKLPILPPPTTTTTTSTTTTIRLPIKMWRKPLSISCAVAATPPLEVNTDVPSLSASSSPPLRELNMAGARVRVKKAVKVFHAQRVGEIELHGMEGVIKQYVGFWKGMSLSASLPFRVEFVKDVEGRGPVKFVAHLKEEEFEVI